jgi:hypothetical protein
MGCLLSQQYSLQLLLLLPADWLAGCIRGSSCEQQAALSSTTTLCLCNCDGRLAEQAPFALVLQQKRIAETLLLLCAKVQRTLYRSAIAALLLCHH